MERGYIMPAAVFLCAGQTAVKLDGGRYTDREGSRVNGSQVSSVLRSLLRQFIFLPDQMTRSPTGTANV